MGEREWCLPVARDQAVCARDDYLLFWPRADLVDDRVRSR